MRRRRTRPGRSWHGVRRSALLLAVGLAACGGEGSQAGAPASLPPFPVAPASDGTRTERAEFVGTETCRECHASEHAAWAGSTHGRAGGAPTEDVLIAPFDQRPIRFADAVVIPRRRGSTYEFVVRQDGHPEQVFGVVGVIGGGHMIGGGTQGFLARLPDGTERFLPWDWSDDASVWFCNTGSRLDRGWVPIDETMRLWDCGDWPPVRPIGTVGRFANCQGCHGSQITTRFDETDRAFATRYTTLAVNCESCHGPASEHVDWARTGAQGSEIGLESLAWRSKDEALEVCFQCHALKDVLREGYLPGEAFREAYALKFPVLGDRPYTPDGRVRTFAYQANHLASACYLDGPMDCASCHEPHGQGYWDVNRRPLASPFDDGQCTACHASKAVDPATHTRHAPDTDGSLCVSCHMPYLQHPEVGSEIPFARSDHTIGVPRPGLDASLGIVGACASCHADRTSEQLDDDVRRLWGEPKPPRPLIAGQLALDRETTASEAAGLLLLPEETDPLLQFQALSTFLVEYLAPDTDLPSGVRERLEALSRGSDLDVRALALAALHWSAGDRPEVRAVLVEALTRDGEPRALRARWELALGFLGDHHRERSEFQRSRTAYRKALELRPDDPALLTNLGLLLSRTGDPREAARIFRRSLELDPAQPLTRVNLGIALESAGDPAGARQAYEDALRQNPHEALAYFNLGNAHQRAGRLPEAADAYARAVQADPGLGLAYFELSRTLIRLERAPEALPFARRAVEFLPEHAPSRQMLADLERAFGGA